MLNKTRFEIHSKQIHVCDVYAGEDKSFDKQTNIVGFGLMIFIWLSSSQNHTWNLKY